VTLLFFLLTLFKKINRIKELKKKNEYQILIDDLLFNLLFSERNLDEIIGSREFSANKNSTLFQQLSIKALIRLHSSYSGNYRIKLEQFFAKSGLAAYSLDKLNSKDWSHI